MATTCLLKAIPPEVYKIIQKEQSVIKLSKGIGKFSLQRTIYKMIKDYDKCRKDVNFKPEEL